MTDLMRFGLVGTGPWAGIAHGPGLLAADGVELVGVWGRRAAPTHELAASLQVEPYAEVEALLADVDAVAFAVPPDVQAQLALLAARAGKHLLLDKPVALEVAAARAVADAVDQAGVVSVVFFTDQFVPEIRAWLETVHAVPGWRGGWMRWFGSLQQPGNPFNTPWRSAQGALWDVGPHAVSTMISALGPVESVVAVPGEGDLAHLTLRHRSGVTSTISVTLFAPPAAECVEAVVWGDAGLYPMPARPTDPTIPLRRAAEELAACARNGTAHAIDVHYGVRVVESLAEAAAQLS